MVRMKPQEAKEAPLSRNPIARIQQLRQYAGEIVGVAEGQRLPYCFTRNRLVDYAHIGEVMTNCETLQAVTANIEQIFPELAKAEHAHSGSNTTTEGELING